MIVDMNGIVMDMSPIMNWVLQNPWLVDDLTTIYRNLGINNMGRLVDIYLLIDGWWLVRGLY